MTKHYIQKRVFNIADKRNLTVGDVKEAIIGESNLALCKMINDKGDVTWCLTEVDVFFPDDDYALVTETVAEQVIVRDDVYHQVLEGIDIYRTV